MQQAFRVLKQAMTPADLLPLPEPWIVGGVLHAPVEGTFTASQMRDYALAHIAAERARCAKIADEHARRNYPWGSENTDKYHAQAHWAARIAAAIREG
jgi:hypothetical protein